MGAATVNRRVIAPAEGCIMRAGTAREIAREWVREEVASLPGFHGAFLAGSINSLPDDASFPAASDVDVKIVMDDPPDTGGPQKVYAREAVLDVSYGATGEFRSPEAVLGSYYTAVHFMSPCVLSDPTGNLAAIQAAVAGEYARRRWVRERCEHVRREVERVLGWLNPAAPIHGQVLFWVVAISLTTHVVQVADLRNPTHRRGPAVMREVLARHGDTALHERYLEILGSAAMGLTEVETLLMSCIGAFEAASAVRTTPFLMGSNISADARPMAIGGIEELIAAGSHREAVFWILLIHTLSQTALHNHADDGLLSRLTPSYTHLLGALDIGSGDALADRAGQLEELLPALREAAEDIIATHPAIRD
jgi:hypothetical protein